MQVIFQEGFIKSKCKSEPGRILLSPTGHPIGIVESGMCSPRAQSFFPLAMPPPFPLRPQPTQFCLVWDVFCGGHSAIGFPMPACVARSRVLVTRQGAHSRVF